LSLMQLHDFLSEQMAYNASAFEFLQLACASHISN